MTGFNFSSNSRFLLVRPDKIGDVLLTTPALTSLRKKYPESFIAFLCRSYTAPLLENNPAINRILKIDDAPYFAIVKKINQMGFDAAIHFYVESRSTLATCLANIPLRIGPFSKFASLLLNKRIVQNRSRVEKHEAEYNLELVKVCGADGLATSPVIFLTDPEKKRGKEIMASLKVDPNRSPVVIHPGSAGSVQNWPLEHFLNLGKKMAERNCAVVFNAGKGEETILERVKDFFRSDFAHIHFIPPGSLSLRELAGVISNARLTISNSTGPLHIAVALNIPTLSFYPRQPLVTSAKRWGPFGNPHLHKVLSPEKENASLSFITVETALQSAEKMLAG